MAHPCMKTLAVLCRGAARGPQRSTYNHWHLEFATGHIMNLGGLVHNLIHRQANEVPKHDVHDRVHAGHGSSYPQTRNAGFRNRRIDHSFWPKFIHQAREHFEWRPGFGYVFTDNEYTPVTTHLLGQSFANGLAKRNFPYRLAFVGRGKGGGKPRPYISRPSLLRVKHRHPDLPRLHLETARPAQIGLLPRLRYVPVALAFQK